MHGVLLGEAESTPAADAILSLVARASGELDGEMKHGTLDRFRREGAVEVEFSQRRTVTTAFGKDLRFRRLFITPPNEDGWLLVVPGTSSYDGHPLRVSQAQKDFDFIVMSVKGITCRR
jgi:hypothetical protein